MRSREEWNCLLEIDDVNAVALGKNVWLHLRIPALCLMPEMDACLEQGFERYPGRLPVDARRSYPLFLLMVLNFRAFLPGAGPTQGEHTRPSPDA